MADAFFTLNLQTSILRRADGLIWGLRVHHTKVVDMWWLLNRETDQVEELRPYRVGMFKEPR